MLVIILVAVSIKRESYVLEEYRVLAVSGILYRRQTSIIFDKVNTINKYQGAMGKLFGFGSVSVRTTSSTTAIPEMTVKNIREYEQFYAILKENYR